MEMLHLGNEVNEDVQSPDQYDEELEERRQGAWFRGVSRKELCTLVSL